MSNGKYKYVRQADISVNKFKKYVNDGPLLKNGDVLISRVGANAGTSYMHNSGSNHVFAGFLVRYKMHPSILLEKYFYYWTKTRAYCNQMMNLRTGAAQPNFNPASVRELIIDIPAMNLQQKIIDIIEPVETLMHNLNKMSKLVNVIINNTNIKELPYSDIFSEIKTGKLNTNVISKNGKYNFYTCGKDIKKSNYSSFNGKYILLSGNGELYSWWYDGKFDLYQRVYALKERKSFFTSLLAVKRGMKKLRQRSNGAVIKFIKLEDIKSIKMLSDDKESTLETLFIFLEKIQLLTSKCNIIKNELIRLLVK